MDSFHRDAVLIAGAIFAGLGIVGYAIVAPLEKLARLYERRFFNDDGSRRP